MSPILDYLVEINSEQSDKILQKVIRNNILVQIKIEGEQLVRSVRIHAVASKSHYIVSLNQADVKNHAVLTFKINLQSRVYFFKTTVLKELNLVLIKKQNVFYELIRRKEPRYIVPYDWSQLAIVISFALNQRNTKFHAKIAEISYSGCKLTLISDLAQFEVGQRIRIQFKILKRAQVSIISEIKHLKKNKMSGPTVGVEFLTDSNLILSKVQNICDDLAYYYTHLLKES